MLELGRRELVTEAGGWVPLISTFSTEKQQENLGPSCAESSRAQENQVYIYPKANASAGVGTWLVGQVDRTTDLQRTAWGRAIPSPRATTSAPVGDLVGWTLVSTSAWPELSLGLSAGAQCLSPGLVNTVGPPGRGGGILQECV